MLSLLRERAGELGAQWKLQVGSLLLLDRAAQPSTEHVADVGTLLEALIGDAAESQRVPENIIGHGLEFGASAFARGASLHHVMKSLDLLASMTLHAVESAMERVETPTVNPADGIRLCRRLQGRASLLSLAATRGYLQAYAETLREGFRHLRHDLRNPLGTIKSVLALMEDESVPLEARVNPSFRAMATRNARVLEELIADRLSDATALLPVVAGQDVSVRVIACAVRRDLDTEAERHGASIVVEQGGVQGRLDAAGLELLLRGTLHAALQECESGEELRIAFEHPAGRANVVISGQAGRAPIQNSASIDRLGTLAGQIGATITTSERVIVSVPLYAGDNGRASSEQERTVPRESLSLGDRETRHDVRGARESHHGQAGAH